MIWLTALLGLLRPLVEPIGRALGYLASYWAGARAAGLQARAEAAERATKAQTEIRHAEGAAASDPRALARKLRERADAARAGRLSDDG